MSMKSNNHDELHKYPCVHRHYWPDHPSCYIKGLIKLPKGENNKLEELQGLENEGQWFEDSNVRIGYLDIESDGLKADFSTMLSWAIKEKGGDTITDFITREELFNGIIDRRIIKSCLDEIRKYNIIVTYNGTYFDIPYLRSKCLHYGLDFPGYITEIKVNKTGETVKSVAELYHWDLYYTVKSKLCLSRKSLESACDYLNIKGKTPLDREIWRKAKYGDPKAIKKVVIHNVADVEILEDLHNRLVPFKKWIKSPA